MHGREGHFSYVSTHIISPSVLIERDVVPFLYKGVPWAGSCSVNDQLQTAKRTQPAGQHQHQRSTMFDSRTTSAKMLQHHQLSGHRVISSISIINRRSRLVFFIGYTKQQQLELDRSRGKQPTSKIRSSSHLASCASRSDPTSNRHKLSRK